jgi:hypothetical protein
MIEQGDGLMARREKLGQCVRCAVAMSESQCKACGLVQNAKPPQTASYVTKLSHDAKPEGYPIHELKSENKKGHA